METSCHVIVASPRLSTHVLASPHSLTTPHAMHTCLLLVVVPLLVVTPGPGGWPRQVAGQGCSPQTYITGEKASAVVTTLKHSPGVGFVNTLYSTFQYVRPQEGFRGVGIVTKSYGTNHDRTEKTDAVWFPLSDSCFPGNDDWWQVWTLAWLEDYSDSYLLQCYRTIKFKVLTSGCVKVCSKSRAFKSITSFEVMGVGPSKWRSSRTNSDCGTITPTLNTTTDNLKFGACVNLPLKRSGSSSTSTTKDTTTATDGKFTTLGIVVVVVVLVGVVIYAVWRWCLISVLTCMHVKRQMEEGV